MSDERLFVGLMSGTSCDGVDAALVRVIGHGSAMRATFLHLTSLVYSDADRHLATAARRNELDLHGLADGGARIARRYAEVVRQLLTETATRPADVTALAAHGQTIYHAPPLTWQLFDPTVLAYETGIDVVSDFRRADCAAGGQGAPLVPFGDYFLFRHPDVPRVIVNIGGIANLTCLPAGGALADVVGFDVGPGNCLSDWLMRDHGGVDTHGRWASTGRVDRAAVDLFLGERYALQTGPKSTDVPNMIALFESVLSHAAPLSLPDRLATANTIVARLITDNIRRFAAAVDRMPEIYVAGGGIHNLYILTKIRLQGMTEQPTDALGVPTQAREATAFALLAAAHVDRLPFYMPNVTGAGRPAILGSLTPGNGSASHVTGAKDDSVERSSVGHPRRQD